MPKRSLRAKKKLRAPAPVAGAEPVPPPAKKGWLVDSRRTIAGGFVILMLAYYWMYGGFFPRANGMLDDDYSYFCPALLDGYFWFHANGLWHVPWFTPSFCGGSLLFPNLQLSYYSFPQFLAFVTGPLVAIQTTVYLFAFIGGAGFYLLLRRGFRMSRWSAFLGGGLFLFNGFYTYRMIIGHFGYHTFMLLPLVAFFLLRPPSAWQGPRIVPLLFDASAAGVLIAFMATSDFVTLMIPALLGVVILGLVHGVLFGERPLFWIRAGMASATGALLSFAKLAAIVAFMQNTPRSGYLLPGVDNLYHALLLVIRCLCMGTEYDDVRSEWVRNVQWKIGQHEWEYSLSPVPFALLLYAAWRLAVLMKNRELDPAIARIPVRDRLALGAALFIGLLPVALNLYAPWWNAFLKTIPVIQSSSTLFRWFILYIPCVVVGAALIVDRSVPRKYQAAVCAAGLACCIGMKATHRNTYYLNHGVYDPRPMVDAFHAVKDGAFTPGITAMAMYTDNKNQVELPVFRNDTFVQGNGQIMGYESLFGYRLEYLPFKTLHPGPALDTAGGVLNVKNPASYLWPEKNFCQPGDHFKIWQKPAAQAFLRYKPFPFRMSMFQVFANWMNLLALVALVTFQLYFLGRKLGETWFSFPSQRKSRSPGAAFRRGRHERFTAGVR